MGRGEGWGGEKLNNYVVDKAHVRQNNIKLNCG